MERKGQFLESKTDFLVSVCGSRVTERHWEDPLRGGVDAKFNRK